MVENELERDQMDLHNTVEDIVIARVNEVFEALNKSNQGNICICDQCRMDVICYALNRTPPHYISSHRGADRMQKGGLEYQQLFADITALVHDGLKKVNHNLRPNFEHGSSPVSRESASRNPAFNLPTITGRIFNGNNFEPMSDIIVELLLDGEIVPMKDKNWQNPYRMVSNTNGNFSFWPAPLEAKEAGINKSFEFALKVKAEGFDTLNHFFKVDVTSEIQAMAAFNIERIFKLQDLYMFNPGEEEDETY